MSPLHGSPSEPRRAETPEEWYPLLILDTVRLLAPPSLQVVVDILLDTKRDPDLQGQYQHYRFVGKLKGRLLESELFELAVRMLNAGYVTWQNDTGNQLRLTALGTEALSSRLTLPDVQPPFYTISAPETPEPRKSAPPPPQRTSFVPKFVPKPSPLVTRIDRGPCPHGKQSPEDCIFCQRSNPIYSHADYHDWERK